MARQILMLWKYNTHCVTDNMIGYLKSLTYFPHENFAKHFYWEIVSPVQNNKIESQFKKKGVLNCKCLGLYVTRQLNWRQTPKLCIYSLLK